MMITAVHCDSRCTNCLNKCLACHTGVPQTPIMSNSGGVFIVYSCSCYWRCAARIAYLERELNVWLATGILCYVLPSIVTEGCKALPCHSCDKSAPLTVYIFNAVFSLAALQV